MERVTKKIEWKNIWLFKMKRWMSLSHVKNKNTDKKMFLDFKPNHLISNVCAQVDQDDVTRKCERVRVYVRRMNILITAIEEGERVTLLLLCWHLTQAGRGHAAPQWPGLTISHPGVGNWKHFLGKQKQGPGEYRRWGLGWTDGRIDWPYAKTQIDNFIVHWWPIWFCKT